MKKKLNKNDRFTSSLEMIIRTMKLKLAQNGIETKVTHRRVEISRFYSISFPYFKLIHMIVKIMSYNNVHDSKKPWDICGTKRRSCLLPCLAHFQTHRKEIIANCLKSNLLASSFIYKIAE